MEGLFLRLYGIPQCPHCETAVQYLIRAGLPPNTIHIVPLAGDPIIEAGIKAITGRQDVPVPVLVSFISNPGEVIVGWREVDYERIVKLIRTSVGASTSNIPAPQGGDSASSAGAPVENRPENGVSDAVSSVSGSVVGSGGTSSSKPN